MNINWSELIACRGAASAKDVPDAIEILFSGSAEEREKAYWRLDNFVVVNGDLYESAPYAARLIVDRIKADPITVNPDVLGILFEILVGIAGDNRVEHGPLKGQPIEQLCRDTIGEALPALVAARGSVHEREMSIIDDLVERYKENEE